MAELSVPVRQRGAVVRVLVRAREPAQPVVPGTTGAARATSRAAAEFGPFPAYLDTGASVTVLDPGVISVLGAEPVAAAGLHVLGRDTVSHHGVYAVEVALADAAPSEREWFALDALDGPVNPKGMAAALGRDFLARLVLTYDGPAGRVRLRW